MFNKLKSVFHFLLSWLSYYTYGMPGKKLIVIGVTGTKGKSSTCRLVASVLEAGGYKVGMLSTVEFQIGEKRWLNDKKMTMLGRGQIQKMLREMVDAGCEYAVVETSSEGILQHRHLGLNYDVAVFTNLGTEHSERHGGFENLKHDKGKLFASLKSEPNKVLGGKKIEKVIVANLDDANADYFLSFAADKLFAYTLKGAVKSSDPSIQILAGKNEEATRNGSCFSLNSTKYCLRLFGDFNNYNAIAAAAVGISQGISPDKIKAGLENVNMIPGRMEFLEEGQPFKVVVDYAHEVLSLNALFTTCRELVKNNAGKVIAVVGSDGGGRDIGKREAMGELSGKLADYVFITDVNCFDESPKAIAEMLARGARKSGKTDGVDLFIEIDRRAAIKQALSFGDKNDIVAITGKGTEPFICVAGGKKIPWDDRNVTKEILGETYVVQK